MKPKILIALLLLTICGTAYAQPPHKVKFYRYRITNLTNRPIWITWPDSSIKGPKKLDAKSYRLGHHRIDRRHIFYLQFDDGTRRYYEPKRNFNNPTTSFYFKQDNDGKIRCYNYDRSPVKTWKWKNLTPPNIIY